MLLLTQDAVLICGHALGKVTNAPSQGWVTVERRSVLVRADPEGRPIAGCVNAAPLKPCLMTLAVRTGYSSLLRVDGREVCLDTVRGFTTGDPPGAVDYHVAAAGQGFVSGDA
jgi:hypothetical protein